MGNEDEILRKAMLIACQKPLEHLPNDNTGKQARQIDREEGGRENGIRVVENMFT